MFNIIFVANVLVICVYFKIYFLIDHHCKTSRIIQKLLKFLGGELATRPLVHLSEDYFNKGTHVSVAKSRVFVMLSDLMDDYDIMTITMYARLCL